MFSKIICAIIVFTTWTKNCCMHCIYFFLKSIFHIFSFVFFLPHFLQRPLMSPRPRPHEPTKASDWLYAVTSDARPVAQRAKRGHQHTRRVFETLKVFNPPGS